MQWLPAGVTSGQVVVGLLENLTSTLIAGVLGYLVGRRGHRKVTINARRVDQMGRRRPQPNVIVATFSGYQKRSAPPALSDSEFRSALQEGDLSKLPIDESTPAIGQMVRLLREYQTSLDELILITTRSKTGVSSFDSAPLLRQYAKVNFKKPVKITTHEDDIVDLDEDDHITNDSYVVARDIFARLEREKRYDPKRVIVDVTGSVRSMQVGVLLACLRPEQDAHIIGTKYGANGEPDYKASFPMLIHFEPMLRD